MEKDDAQLIRRILSGDNTAFTTLVEKYYRSVSRPRVAEDQRFSSCGRNHTRHLPSGIQKTLNA